VEEEERGSNAENVRTRSGDVATPSELSRRNFPTRERSVEKARIVFQLCKQLGQVFSPIGSIVIAGLLNDELSPGSAIWEVYNRDSPNGFTWSAE